MEPGHIPIKGYEIQDLIGKPVFRRNGLVDAEWYKAERGQVSLLESAFVVLIDYAQRRSRLPSPGR